nr:MAG TPA: hypothetical protein [Caudoviricetes sp.]
MFDYFSIVFKVSQYIHPNLLVICNGYLKKIKPLGD